MPRKKREKITYKLGRIPGKPNIYVIWTDWNGRSKSVSTGTEDPAEAKKFLHEFESGINTPSNDDKFKVEVIIDEYLEHKKYIYERDKQSVKNYKILQFHLRPVKEYFMGYKIKEIKRPLIRAYTDKLRAEGLSNGTIRKRLTLLTAAFNHGRKEGWYDTVPYIDKPQSPPPRERRLTKEERDRLFKACAEQFHVLTFALLEYHTTSRKSANLQLKWSQVDLEKRRIDFNKPGVVRTNKRRTVVTINDTLYNQLSQARELAQSDYVVEYNGKRVEDIKRGFAAACKRAGLEGVTSHILRHTAICEMVEKNVYLSEVAAITGDSIKTLEKHYIKYSPEYLEKASRALNEG
jgi:integrase